jgi:hypothetical protein
MNSFSIRLEFDVLSRVRKIAMWNILLPTFVIFCQAWKNVSFSCDVNKFVVIIPIEKMVCLFRVYIVPEYTSVGKGGAFETVLLLRTISKIAFLMRARFGEAGEEIICRNFNMASAGKHGTGGIYAT